MKRIILAALVGVLVSGPAYAKSDHPTVGAVHNTKEASRIWYNCDLKNPSTLECKFTYSSVRKKAKPEDWAKDLAKAEKNFPDIKKDWEKGDTTKLCADMRKGLEIYTGKSSLPKDQEKILSELPEGQKADIRKMLNAFKETCQNFSKSALIKFGRLEHEKKLRTCIIYSSFDRQTFERQGENEWVSVQKDRGICKSVIVERFEKAKTDFNFWIFFRRKTVTNPSRKFFKSTCREISDETEHKFDWRDRELFMNCDYIEFGL